MDHKEFDRVVKKQLDTCKNVLLSKGEEYGPVDRLHNFKVASAVEGCTLQQALGGMMSKHTVSVYDMIKADQDFPTELWEEKITDHINYLILLKAIVVEGKKGV